MIARVYKPMTETAITYPRLRG